ncbi:hypothetical protein, partial [Polaribacter sp. 20A6]|uniref:hypothetical protein n=1 Tax=Polaribacter sp. 20A6 TaxID=2687289 RepID=UPI00197B6376
VWNVNSEFYKQFCLSYKGGITKGALKVGLEQDGIPQYFGMTKALFGMTALSFKHSFVILTKEESHKED